MVDSLVNPTTGKKIGEISAATNKDVDLAVNVAQKAFESSWGLKKPGTERGKLMLKLATLIEEHADELAAIETLNSGKRSPISGTKFSRRELNGLRSGNTQASLCFSRGSSVFVSQLKC